MANATANVKKGTVSWSEEYIQRSTETLASETTFYRNAMIGVDSTGYFCKGDDAQAWIFAGVVRGREGDPVLAAGTAGDAALALDVHQPKRFELTISSVAVTDIGKPVYAIDDQTGTLDPSTRTYANVVGHVVDVVATNIALVEPAYDGVAGNARLQAAKFTAATGTQTLSKFDVGKTVFLPNTAGHTLNLPAVADCPAGSVIRFVKTTSDAAAVTLDGNSSETIDGSTTLATIDAQYDCATLVSTGSAWIVLSRDIT